MTISAFRASIIHFLRDPEISSGKPSFEYFKDGLMILKDGLVQETGPAGDLLEKLPSGAVINDYTGRLIIPGFIDTHIHYPQTDIIASYGKQLLEWLETYTFPAEKKFSDYEVALDAADFFTDELLRNGTTSALVMCTVHKESVDAFFEKAAQRNLRMIAGKVMMDRNAPQYLLDTADSGFNDSKDLIEKWHHRDRLLYAVTPRFAPTSTEAQLKASERLLDLDSGLYLHTHLAENEKEVNWIKELYPWSRSYLDVYDHFGLVRKRSVFAHCIHTDSRDLSVMREKGAAISFCPTSNLFIGSGLFDYGRSRSQSIRVGLATDVGGGTSFSMLKTMSEGYKVQQLLGQNLSPLRAFYLATLGGAETLYLEDKIGNFEAGKEADFTVLSLDATPLVKRRMSFAESIDEKLFILMMLGDDRSVEATYVMGKEAYRKPDCI